MSGTDPVVADDGDLTVPASASLDLLPAAGPLTAHLDRAMLTTDTAQEQLHHVLMRDVARIVRAALPPADSIIVDARDRDVYPEGVVLHAILDAEGQTLWQRGQQPNERLTSLRTSDDFTWTHVVFHLGSTLTSALGPDDPSQWWQRHDDDHHEELYRAELPTADQVAELLTVPDRHLAAYLSDRDAGPYAGFWLAAPVFQPTMTVAGVAITASHNPDGGLTVDIDTTRTDAAVMAPAGPDAPIVVHVNAVSLAPMTATGREAPTDPTAGVSPLVDGY